MIINMDTVLLDIRGQPMQRGTIDDHKPLLLRDVCQDALLATYADEKELNGEAKVKRWLIALKCNDLAANFTVEEVAEIKRLLAKGFGPLVVGRAYELLENQSSVKSAAE